MRVAGVVHGVLHAAAEQHHGFWPHGMAHAVNFGPAGAGVAKKQFAGVELPNRTLGIIGLGAIGSLVADTAIKLGMKVAGFDPEITVDAAWRLPSSVRKANSIEELLK